jgi:hypothetical protein
MPAWATWWPLARTHVLMAACSSRLRPLPKLVRIGVGAVAAAVVVRVSACSAISHSPSGTIQLHVPRPIDSPTSDHHIGHRLKRGIQDRTKSR